MIKSRSSEKRWMMPKALEREVPPLNPDPAGVS